MAGFRHALQEIGTCSPIFLTQNDGTVISEQQALATPIFTFASGQWLIKAGPGHAHLHLCFRSVGN